jgi:hypothetical protein
MAFDQISSVQITRLLIKKHLFVTLHQMWIVKIPKNIGIGKVLDNLHKNIG